MLTRALYALLHDVRKHSDDNFAGVGIIVADAATPLPIYPLRPLATCWLDADTRSTLLSISVDHHDLHDGFHLLSPKLEVLALSQYFSPPIVPGLSAGLARRVGGRYMAALFGSALPGVLATGVASVDYGVAVFFEGVEVTAP